MSSTRDIDSRRCTWATEPDQKRACALDVISWHYPRPIWPFELESGYWFRYGPSAVFWYQWLDSDPTLRSLILHLCIAPEARGLIYPRDWLAGVRILGEILGGDRLIVTGVVGDAKIPEYLKRMGWEEREGALVFELQRRFDGETLEAPETPEAHSQA